MNSNVITVRFSSTSTRVALPGAASTLASGPDRPLAVAHAIGLTLQRRDSAADAEPSARARPALSAPRAPTHCSPSSAQRRASWGDDADDDRILDQIGGRS